MSNLKITSLPELTSVDDDDVLAIVDLNTNVTKKIKKSNLVVPASGTFALTSDLTGRPFTTVGFSNADYIVDGTDDQVQIQAAIAALPANGGFVYLKEGTYSISSQILIDAHNITLAGAGIDATKLVSTVATFDMIRMGTRQQSGIMRNNMILSHLTVTHQGGASTNACVYVDGGGRGTTLDSVRTNEGGYGFILEDLDRCMIINCDTDNPRTAGVKCVMGLENTYGKVQFINCSQALSDNNSMCFLFDADADQVSPNAFGDMVWIGNLFFSTTGLTGTIGIKATVGLKNAKLISSQFESPIYHIILIGTSTMNIDSCSILQNNYPTSLSTDFVQFNTNGHSVTVMDCTFQQVINLFNGVTGFSNITFLGRNNNQGNITNLFTGSFASKMGTDTDFAGNGNLVTGLDNERYDSAFVAKLDLTDGISAPGATSGHAKIYVDTSDGDLKIIFGDGTVKTIVTDT